MMRRLALLLVCLVWTCPVSAQNPTPGLDAVVASLTKVTVQSGDYHAGSTWQGGSVPGPLEAARIDHAVTCRNQPITVTTLLVNASGSYTDLPADGSCAITISDVPLDLVADPEQYGHGIVVLGGWRVEGLPKVRWTRLTAELLVGQTTLRVESATGWVVGDRLVVADSRPTHPDQEPRVAGQVYTIKAVSGLVVTLDRAVTVPAPASRDTSLGLPGVIEHYSAVGNLAVQGPVIKSANPLGVRGHFLVTRMATFVLKHVRIEDFGRTTSVRLHPQTNHIGRYALHEHHLHGTPPIVEGVVIERATRWGFAVHHTNNGVVKDNLVYLAWGAGITTEDGTESGNLFEHNLVIGIQGTNENRPGEVAIGGAAFWMEGVLNTVRENVGANSRWGFGLFGRRNQGVGLVSFVNNEAINNDIGLSAWEIRAGATSYIDGFYSYHNRRNGLYIYPNRNLIIRDYTDRGALAPPYAQRLGANWWGDYTTEGGKVIRPRISGVGAGLFMPVGNADGGQIPKEQPREFLVEDGVLGNNGIDILTERRTTSAGSQPYLVAKVVRTKLLSQTKITRRVTSPPGTLVYPDELFIVDLNGVAGDSFEVFYNEFAPADAVARTGVVGKVRSATAPPPVVTPVDCQVSAWSAWSGWTPMPPPRDLLDEHQTRSRTVVVQPLNGGRPCDPLVEEEIRPIEPPPVDPPVDSPDKTHATAVTVGGDVWTIRVGDGATLRNGVWFRNGRAHATLGIYAVCSGNLYVLGTNLRWYRASGTNWIESGTIDPCPVPTFPPFKHVRVCEAPPNASVCYEGDVPRAP